MSKNKSSFDHKVHIRDSKSGEVIRSSPYRRFVKKGPGGEAVVTYERDKVLFHEDGTPVAVATKEEKAGDEKPAEKKPQARAS